MSKYRIVITGPTGVGKSTVIDMLSELIPNNNNKWMIYPEFISTEFGEQIFNEYMSGNISALTFQSYVLDFYDKDINDSPYAIFERCAEDSVIIFSRNCVRTGTMTQNEYDTLDYKSHKIIRERDLPTYEDSDARIIRIYNNNSEETALDILGVIREDIMRGIRTRIVILKTSLVENEKRIRSRNRNGESSFDDDYIKHINRYYDEI